MNERVNNYLIIIRLVNIYGRYRMLRIIGVKIYKIYDTK